MSSNKKPKPNYEEFRKRRDEEKSARQERIKDRLNEIRLNKLANVAKLNAELKENQFYIGAIAGAGATQKIQKTGSVAAANQKPLLPNNAKKTEPTLQSPPLVKGSPVKRKVETKAAIKNVPTKKSFGVGGIVSASARKSPRVNNVKSKVDLISNRRKELNVWKKEKDLQIKKLVSSNTSKLVGQTKSFLSKTTSNLSADKKSLVKNSSTAVNKISLNKTVNQCPPNKQKIENTFSKKAVPIQIAPTSKKASSVAASHPARRMTVIHSNVVTKRNSLSKQFLKSRKSIAVVANSALGFSNKHDDVALRKTANNTKSTTKSAEVVIAATQQPLTTELQPHNQRATTSAAATSTTSTQPQKPISYTIDIKPIPSSVTKRRRTTMFKSQYQPKENLTKSVMKEKLTDWLKTQGKSPTAYKRHMCCYGLHKDSPLHSSTTKKAQPKEHMRLKNLKLESIKLPSLSISLNAISDNDDNITSDKNDVKTLTITEEPASLDKNEEPTSSDKRERRTTEGNVAGCVAPQSERKLPNRGVRIMGEVQEKNVFRSSDIFYLCKEIKENLNRTSSFLDRSSLINVDCSSSSNNSKSQTTPASKRSFEKSIIKPGKTNNDGDEKRDDNGNDKRDDDGGKREGDDKKDEHLGNKSVKKCRFHHDEKRNGRNDNDDKGGDGDESIPPFFGTPHKKCYVITPVRRSTRKSCLATKHSVMDGDVIVESMDELPVETKERSIFRSNKRIAIFGNSDAERDNHNNNNNNNNNGGGEIDGKGRLYFGIWHPCKNHVSLHF
ncbi:hypothetical protein HELRODRAFT_188449 [Helobdella robusta]|uniref:Uncharacterized protein n=1 Tax=Helobdella robusta TaxID=6412 RepID=T1FQ00_HELRO|nr:hypothetical protein HELRODRAFT_188449 [Helobdella robusta]ESO06685.1 hypothetical protein HELRODRAFT_188449 [Helobdella robusta]